MRIIKLNITGIIVDTYTVKGTWMHIVEGDEPGEIEGAYNAKYPLIDCRDDELELLDD